MDVIYNNKEKPNFEGIITKVEEMTEQEQERFMLLLQGYQAGIQVGLRMAGEQQERDELA